MTKLVKRTTPLFKAGGQVLYCKLGDKLEDYFAIYGDSLTDDQRADLTKQWSSWGGRRKLKKSYLQMATDFRNKLMATDFANSEQGQQLRASVALPQTDDRFVGYFTDGLTTALMPTGRREDYSTINSNDYNGRLYRITRTLNVNGVDSNGASVDSNRQFFMTTPDGDNIDISQYVDKNMNLTEDPYYLEIQDMYKRMNDDLSGPAPETNPTSTNPAYTIADRANSTYWTNHRNRASKVFGEALGYNFDSADAVAKFQREFGDKYGLKEDGLLGENTWNALMKETGITGTKWNGVKPKAATLTGTSSSGRTVHMANAPMAQAITTAAAPVVNSRNAGNKSIWDMLAAGFGMGTRLR